MEDRVENLIMMERSEPKRRILASDGALYAVLLVGVIGVIVLGYDLSARFMWPRLYVQIGLYALLLATGYYIYRFRLISYRYTLTERMLRVDRIVGVKERETEQVRLSDIREIRPVRTLSADAQGRRSRLYTGRLSDAVAVCYRTAAGAGTLYISPGKPFCDELVQAWKKSNR